jgi:hypothetical protein
MRPFIEHRLLLVRITLTVSNLRLSEQLCMLLCRAFRFTYTIGFNNFRRKESILFFDSKETWFRPKKTMVYLKNKKQKTKKNVFFLFLATQTE